MSTSRKRRDPNRQLQKEEVEKLDDNVTEAGVFQKASEEDLKKRKVVRANRSKFSAAANSNETTTSPAIFSGFTFNQPVVTTSSDAANAEKSPAIFGAVTNGDKEGPSEEFKTAVRELNGNHFKKIQLRLDSYPYLPLTDEIHEYLDECDKINKKFNHPIKLMPKTKSITENNPVTTAEAPGAITSAGFTFNIPASTATPLSNVFSFRSATPPQLSAAATLPKTTGFTFSLPTAPAAVATNSSAASPPSNGFLFKPTPFTSDARFFNKPLDIPGAIASSPSAVTSTDSKEVSSTAKSNPSTGFVFNLPTSSNVPSVVPNPTLETSENDDGEEKKDQPSKLERDSLEDEKESVIYEIRSKLYKTGEEDGKKVNKDLGTGIVRLMQDRETKKCRIVMRNDSGRVILNCGLYDGIKFIPTEKSSSVAFMFPGATEGAPMEACTLKVKKGALDEFVRKLEEAKSF